MLSLCKTWIDVLIFSIHFWALLQFQYHSCEEIVYFSMNFSTTFIQYIQRNEVTSGQQVLSRCFHCARLESMYWYSVYTFGALLHFQYHSCEEIVYFSRDFSTTFNQYIQCNEVTSGQQVLYRCFHCARLESKYWNSVYTFGALLQFQYHSCEEIVYFSMNFSTTFIQYIQLNEVTSGQQVLSRCFHCARLESMYWNSVSTFGALLHFQYHSCEEIVYYSMNFSTTFIQYIQLNEVTSGQQVLYQCFHCARLESKYWKSVYTFGTLLQFQYHSCEEIVYFSRDFSTTFIQYIKHTEVTSGQHVLYRCIHCARLESMYWNSVSTFGALLHFQYHSSEEIVYFSMNFSTTFIQYIQRNEVTSGQQVSSQCFHFARLESMYWNSESTFGALLHFQYHSCEEIVYFSMNFSTTFIQYIQHNEVTSGQQVLYRCFHCARLESMYWNSVSTFGALLHFQYHSSEEIVYFSMNFSTTFIQYIQLNEVTSGQQVLYWCFQCARLESKYWKSVYTFGALLQFQYHSCEEIVFFSRDFSTTFIQYIKHTEVTSGQQVLYRCIHCARLESMYWNSVSTFGALLHYQYHSCEEIVYFSRDFSTTFIQYIQRNEVTLGQQVLYRCFHCARLESMYWNLVSTFGALLQFQYHSCEEIVYFSMNFSTTFIQYIQRNEVTSGQQVLYRCFHCARLESMYWNSVSTFGALLHFQ